MPLTLSLNGTWQAGHDRHYDREVQVPGLATDPAQINPATLWYRRQVELPQGDWTHATLILNGARFRPAVYVNGDKVSEAEGGMASTTHRLNHPALKPGNTITLEIALASLNDVPVGDASRIPPADRWRSNVSSCLWDDVVLHLHPAYRIGGAFVTADPTAQRILVHWRVDGPQTSEVALTWNFRIWDQKGVLLTTASAEALQSTGTTEIDVSGVCEPWSPEVPSIYKLDVDLFSWPVHPKRWGDDEPDQFDSVSLMFALRDFRLTGKQFQLNGQPLHLRAGSIVWHRWCRDPEVGPTGLAWDEKWFEENIILRLKSHGANALRFHLGMPPERFLDLCDKHGLLVQAEWSFFHNMDGSPESLLKQWRDWLDLCARHPCVVIAHAWNEHEGPEVETAFKALDILKPEYPQFAFSHRDVMHPHKYWWSLFENVGIYYDSIDEFPLPIMVDEFGGNYLDGDCNPGKYPTVRESMLRFLGRNHTREQRLQLQCDAYARVAEYWRRLGAAGFSPFCIAGSREDGNHLFLGPIKDAVPKPVWDALTAAYSPVSVSLDLWDRNFLPGQAIPLQLHLFNDTDQPQRLDMRVRIVPDPPLAPTSASPYADRKRGRADYFYGPPHLQYDLAPFTSARPPVLPLTISDAEGPWHIEAELENPPPGITHPVISRWHVQTIQPRVPKALTGTTIGLLEDELELRAMLTAVGLPVGGPDAPILLTSLKSWQDLATALPALESALQSGRHVVMLDIGPRPLGEGYPTAGIQRHLQGQPQVADHVDEFPLPLGLRALFRALPEPESCIHPPLTASLPHSLTASGSQEDPSLWHNLPRRATQLWNGLKGGLIVPAVDLELTGLAPDAFLRAWTARGADAALIQADDYLAYELAGFFAFSVGKSDEIARQLRAKVQFLVDDAPALALSINPNAPIRTHDLSALYRRSQGGQARILTPLVNAGKNLTRVPVIQVQFAEQMGTLILSQLLTAGRLAKGFGESGPYGIRYDPAAVQFVLNLLAKPLSPAGNPFVW